MPRPLRIEYPGSWHLVQNVSAGVEPLFQDDEDRLVFMDLLGEVSEIFGIEVYAYALMDEEYAIVVFDPKGELSRAMRHLNGVYTQRYKETWDFEGPVFKSRYKSVCFDPEEYLQDMVVMVHRLPLLREVTDKPVKYEWSSHKAYIKDSERPEWLHTKAVLKPLSFLKAFALAKLTQFVEEGLDDETEEQILNARQILGPEDFIEAAQALSANSQKTHIQQIKENKKVAQSVLEYLSTAYQTEIEDIKSSRSGKTNEARNMAVYQLRKVLGLTQKEIAKVLQASSPYTVAKVLERMNTRLEEDEELFELTSQMSRELKSYIQNEKS